VPSRGAQRDELVALAGVVRDYPGTMLEGIFEAGPSAHAPSELQLMIDMSLAGDRPINWNLFSVAAARAKSCQQHFENIEIARRANAAVIPLTLPIPAVNRMSLFTGFLLKTVPGWERVWQRPTEDTMRLFADPEKRAELNALAVQASARYDNFVDFAAFQVIEVFSEQNRQYLGRKVGDIAAERGADAFDVLVEICLADELRTGLLPRAIGEDDASWKLRVDAIRDGRTIVGGSDAGAHLDLLNAFVYPAELLDGAVRKRQLLTLEHAVHLMTQSPARYTGLTNRGVLAPGMAADLIVFDPDGFDAGPVRTVHDLPGNCERLYADAVGMDHVIVNGTGVIAEGRLSGDLPGRLLKSGRDTTTVTPRQWNDYVADKKVIPTST
jgi:N-acyl-D-aspartate/D-glutamate deacylase